jgi:hypothetical protein
LVKRGCLGGISEIPLLPLRGWSVSGMYVCMYVCNSRYLISPTHEIIVIVYWRIKQHSGYLLSIYEITTPIFLNKFITKIDLNDYYIRHTIIEAKQLLQSPVIGWVTKNLLSSSMIQRTSWMHSQFLASTNLYWNCLLPVLYVFLSIKPTNNNNKTINKQLLMMMMKIMI